MSETTPVDPTSHAQPDSAPRDEAPPDPPHETVAPPVEVQERYFEVQGQQWVARVSGKGAPGTGAYGLGMIEAIHFFDAAHPDLPLREALLARNRFYTLFDAELAELLGRATPIVIPEDR